MPSIECPDCGEQFHVVSLEDEGSGKRSNYPSPQLDVRLSSWRRVEPQHPYSADTEMDSDEIERAIQRIKATIEVEEETIDFEFFQKSADRSHFWTHVVRGHTDAGKKSKNAVVSENGGLYVKNRGIPWTEDEQWTYLSRKQLAERSAIAGLGEVIEVPDSDGGLGVLLDEDNRPLVVDGTLQKGLVLKLAKALLVFQSERNPVR